MDPGVKLILSIIITSFLVLGIVSFAVVASKQVEPQPNVMFWHEVDGGTVCNMRKVDTRNGYRIDCFKEKIK